MPTFETLEKRELEFANQRFLQVARKASKDDNGSTEFLAVSIGYKDSQGSRRYKTNLTLPVDEDVVVFTIEALASVAGLEDWDVPEEARKEVE